MGAETERTTVPVAQANHRCYYRDMENRAYTFAFLGILAIVCLGGYVAVNALFDPSGDPLIRFNGEAGTPTIVALGTRPGTRTPTPTNTPFLFIIPTIIFPTATRTPLPPTNTATLPPFPTPRPLPTRTPTATPPGADTPTTAPGVPTNTQAPVQPPTNTPVPPPPSGGFAYVPSGPSVERLNCASQYIIYGYVRDAGGQGQPNVIIRFVRKYPFVKEFRDTTKGGGEAGRYEFTAGGSSNEYDLTLLDAGDRALSPTVHVTTKGFDEGNCWFQVNWRRN